METTEKVDLTKLEVAPLSDLANYEDFVLHPGDGVGNSTLREGFNHLYEDLHSVPSPEEYQKRFNIAEKAETEKLQPKRHSFQWFAGKFEGASEQLKELGVESYDDFNEFKKDPETQLGVLEVLKRMSAGVVSDYELKRERKIKGAARKIPEELRDTAYNTFYQLTDLEVGILENIEDRTQEQEAHLNRARTRAKLARKIPLKAANGAILTALVVAGCEGGNLPTVTPSQEESQPKVTEVVQAPEQSEQNSPKESQEQNREIGAQLLIKEDDDFEKEVEEILGKDLEDEQITTFAIGVETARFKFAQSKEKDENGNTTERLFFKSKGSVRELTQTTQKVEGADFVVWNYPNDPEDGQIVLEPVLWYPALTREQWQKLTPEDKLMVFAPPAAAGDELPWYDRGEDLGFKVDGLSLGVDQIIIPITGSGEGTEVPNIPDATEIPNIEATQTAVAEEVQAEEKLGNVTALQEAMLRAGPSEVIADPERNDNGQWEVIKENQKDFIEKLREGVYHLNKDEYVAELNEHFGQNIQDFESFKAYLESNNWILPLVNGKSIRLLKGRGNYVIALPSERLNCAVSLKNLGVMRFGIEEYNKAVYEEYDIPDPLIKNGALMYPYRYYPEASIKFGFGRHMVNDNQLGEYCQLSIQITQEKDYEIDGFPSDGMLNAGDVDEIDSLSRFLLYGLYAVKPYPEMTFMHYLPDIDSYDNSGGINKKGYTKMLGISSVYEEFKLGVTRENYPDDVAPPIIRLTSQK